MKVNEIIVEGPFSRWVGGHLQNFGQRLGAKDTTAITAKTQEAALDQRVKAWLQAKQQYTTAGAIPQETTDTNYNLKYKAALDQWLDHQYNAEPAKNFTVPVTDKNVKDYIANSLANKMVVQQTSRGPAPAARGYGVPQVSTAVDIVDSNNQTWTYTPPAGGTGSGEWTYKADGSKVTDNRYIQALNKIYIDTHAPTTTTPAPATP